MNPKIKNFLFFFLGAFGMMFLMYLFNNYKIEKKNNTENTEISYQKSYPEDKKKDFEYNKESSNNRNSYKESEEKFDENSIENLTNDVKVINYIKANGELPDYYITKSEAKSMGWVPSKGNLCEVAPGKAIGGDIWTNRQKSLPTKSGRKYFEADLNYNCGNRNADRVVFSNDGLVFVTFDHYRSFEEK